jgi:lactate permease
MPQDLPIPVDLLHWGMALLPIVILLVLLVGVRWKAPEAGPIGMFIAAAIAYFLYQAPLDNLAVAGAKGIWDALFILYVIWPALLLYRVTDRAGAFVAIREGIERFSRNELFLVLAFGWVFASFLQGITGFGAPIAVVAPLLIALGVRPVYAVVIPLIGHAWANLFGTLAVAWLATEQVVTLEDPTATAFQTALLLIIPNLTAGLAIAWMYGRMAGVRHAIPMVLIISAIHCVPQLGLALINPLLATFVPSILAVLALYPLSRWKRYDEQPESITARPAMAEDLEDAEQEREAFEEAEPEPVMGFGMAIMPYAVLTVLAIVVLAVPPLEEALDNFEVGVVLPVVETGYGYSPEAENDEADNRYNPFSPLTHPGTFLLLASLAGWVVYRMRGYYDQWEEEVDRSDEDVDEIQGIWGGLIDDAVPASIAVVSFLAMSTLMSDSGQTNVLAVGISDVAPAMLFAFMANWIGLIGSFMTSSNTASNILFAPLQEMIAQTEGLPEPAIIAAQHVGGATGNAISPSNVVLGTGTAGVVGKEGDVLRKVLPWAVVVAVLVGAATVGLALVG